MFKTKQSKADAKAQWMANTEAMIIKLKPSLAGRLEWVTLFDFYFLGLSSDDAAHKYVSNRCDE